MAKKNPISEYLSKIGRKGGQKKVKKGLGALSPEERKEISRKGVAARRRRKKAAPE